MSIDRILDVLHHMEWADALTWRSTFACAAAGTDRLIKERLHHIHEVQWAYLCICRSEDLQDRDLDGFDDLPAVRAWARQYYAALSGWLPTVDEGGLGSPLHLPWADRLVQRFGAARPVTLEEGLLQVAMHSTYHRGQVATRLRDLSGDPQLSDYIVWLWRGRPGPDWGEDL